MPNTGQRITLTLKLKNVTQGTYPGVTKPNLPGDPDYVPPVMDTALCPVPTTLTCPLVSAAPIGADGIFFELSLPVTVLVNPAMAKLDVMLKDSSDVTVETISFTDFNPNYISDTFTGLVPDDYTIDLVYRNGSNTIIHTCEGVAEVSLEPVITWEGIDPFCEVVGSCTVGTYDPVSNTCLETDEVPATPPSGGGGTPALAWHVTNEQWNNGGAQIFAPGYLLNGSGTVAATLTTPHFWVNGNTPFDAGSRNNTDSRMNAAGLWVDGETSDPINEWIGFVRRVDVPTARTVYIGMCADNRFRFSLNGTLLVDCPGTINGGNNFNYMNIYPVALAPGPNYIEMWALNNGSVAGFAAEIYDQSYASLVASTQLSDLNIIFSTSNMFGESFDLGETVGWSCPAGYSLDTSGPGDPVCVQVTVTPAESNNTGMKGFANRRRLVNGLPDGFTEPNTEVGGVGPYIPPVEDLVTCVRETIFARQFTLQFV